MRDYRVAHLSDLGDQQEADLRRAEMSLRKASDQVDNAGINLALDDAQEALSGLGKVTQLLKADVSKLADVTKSLEIVTALVQIGTAFAEGNPGGIVSAIWLRLLRRCLLLPRQPPNPARPQGASLEPTRRASLSSPLELYGRFLLSAAVARLPPRPIVSTADEGTMIIEPRSLIAS